MQREENGTENRKSVVAMKQLSAKSFRVSVQLPKELRGWMKADSPLSENGQNLRQERIDMARKLIILCEKDLLKILKPENVAAPEADPKPVLAGHVIGTFATPEQAEQAIVNFNCEAKHYIVEALKFRRISL